MHPIPLIHNPAARSTKSARLGNLLAKLTPVPRIIVTDGPGSARQIAADCARQGEPVVVAGGGDGTVNEVVAGFLDAAADGHPMPALGLMPLGTMNVFALETGLPVRNIHRCWETVAHGVNRPVDLWLVNGQPLVQLGGVGLDASVVAETTWEMKKRMGPLGYLINAARVLTRPAPELDIHVDGFAIRGALALLGNGERYGGPLKIFPGAKLDDGLLDILVLRKQTAPDILGFLAALATGSLDRFQGVWLGRGREISITSARTVPLELDGDAAGHTPVAIRHASSRLHVRVPCQSWCS